MSYPKIQKSLFSFKTFRSPDRNDLTKSIYHIYHPDFTKSKFYNCKEVIGRTEDEEEEEDKSVNQTSDFIKTLNPINDYRQIKEQYATIFELSTKLESYSRPEIVRRLLTQLIVLT